jgi:glycosyltransferase involved in cell wall biosynthesis
VRVAYVVSLFPKISETFILREMLALRARGVEVLVVSLKRRRESLVHPEAAPLLASTIYAGRPGPAAAALAVRTAGRPAAAAALAGRVAAAHAARPALLAKSLPLVAVAAEVAGILEARGVDRVHAHWATYPALVAWAVRRLSGIPYSMTAHAHDIFLPNPLLAAKVAESEFTVTISEYNRRRLAEICGPAAAAKVHVIHCGVPLAEYPARREPPSGPPKIVSVGRLVDYKGFPTLLRAVAALRSRGIEVLCDIVGDGPLEGRVRAAVRELGLDGAVRLLGPRTQDEVRGILLGAGACVLACERGRDGQMDGIPVVLMEAMALGVPAVATRLSGIPEIIEDGTTGLLAEPGDAASLAAAVERVLKEPALAARLGAAGRRKVEESFDLGRSAEALHRLLAGSVAAVAAPGARA